MHGWCGKRQRTYESILGRLESFTQENFLTAKCLWQAEYYIISLTDSSDLPFVDKFCVLFHAAGGQRHSECAELQRNYGRITDDQLF